ncbi:unnamed protein product [Ranitomeya imitator]|uniref:Tf2-1-like SH3-like domain-containing protein n=1 Tax=Ranitomeya imitator TaxID=111125 RepID=A0ABN9MNG1_9NEOB|nr:unnamed protein product [Ranitomeya imitator]
MALKKYGKTYRRYSDFHDFHMRITEQLFIMDVQSLASSLNNLAAKVQNIQDFVVHAPMSEPRIPIPEFFSGDRSSFLNFRNNCKLFLSLKSRSSGDPAQQVKIVISFLRGDPQNWAFALAPGDPALLNVDAFFLALGLLYEEPNLEIQAEKALLALSQGQDEAEIYCQKFRKWSVLTQWNECALAARFRDGLSEAIKDVMVGFPAPTGLNESMTMAIQIDRRLRESKPVHHLAVSSEQAPETMQCDRIQSRSERQNYRRKNGLCFYCGDSAHVISACSKRTKKVDKSVAISTLQSKFILSVTLICSLSAISVDAYVDSGAALSLMDWSFANRCGFSLEPLEVPVPLKGIDSTPLAMNKPQYWTQVTMRMTPVHQEVIRFLSFMHDIFREYLDKFMIVYLDDVLVFSDDWESHVQQVEPSDCAGVDMVVDRLHQIWSHVVDNLKLSQERAQQFANRRRRVGPRLRVGDLVWLSSRFVPMKVSSPKFKPRFIGPYRILEILNPVSFRLDLPASFAIHNVFHRSLLRKYEFENLASVLKLPGKKTFNNMDKEFLEKRKNDLNAYLQFLLSPELLKACPALAPCVFDFLENKAYNKGKGDFARKMDTIVNPLRNSMRNVSNAVKSIPDSLAEGMNKMSDNVGKMSEKIGQDLKQSLFKKTPVIVLPLSLTIMSSLYLKLNLSKTELLVFSPSTNLPLPDIAISVCGSTITPKQHARCLGVILDSDLSFTPYIRSLARSSYLHLKNISRIRPF